MRRLEAGEMTFLTAEEDRQWFQPLNPRRVDELLWVPQPPNEFARRSECAR
jgi:hypothetical protein